MRLSDVLSKPPKEQYVQVDGFLQNKKGYTGQKVNLDVGKVALNYFCGYCDDLRTFYSQNNLSCVFVNKNIISIDCVVTCGCGNTVPVWFLIESKDSITGQAPEVRILKRNFKLSEKVKVNTARYGEFALLLDKAEQAYNDGLGAGSIVYLRKVFEKITIQTANDMEIKYSQYKSGNPKNFSNLLKEVDEKCSIIPKEFSANGYQLFQELSTVIHGEYDEELGLRKFESLYRLVIGILENVKNHSELINATIALGWDNESESVK